VLGALRSQRLQKSALRLLLEEGADRDEDWDGCGCALFGWFSQADQAVVSEAPSARFHICTLLP